MYPVSAAYKTAIQQNVRDVKITGTITLKDDTIINIADEDIVQGSLYITEQCVSGEDIEVGNVYAAEMGLSLTTPLEDPYALDGARILLHFGLDVGGLWETVPLGYFYVTEIERKLLNVKLTALDGMLLFDVPCGQPGPGTPAGFVAHACSIAGVTLANAAEVSTFANAALGFNEPDETKVKTCRDLVMWACQLMGAFARLNRQGQLEIVPITMRESVKDIVKSTRFNSKVSDFGVKITKVAMTVGESEYSRGTEGMTMLLEENPMVAGLDASIINTMLDNLRAQVTKAVYVPFNSDFIGDPALQPGDYITIKDAGILESETETYFYSEHSPLEVQRNYVTSMITHSTWRYRGAHNIKAVGKSAMIRGVQQQQVKALSSVIALAKMAQSVALAANQSAQLINDAIGGHILIRQAPDETNEILIMDNPDPTLATKIWRWNMGGLGYSDNCTGADNPERTYTVAITMDGAINANFIKAGMIGAQYITIGTQTTFEEGYDPSKLQPVGMAADSNCTGLWHFDGSLNSHKGISAEFDGSFSDSKWGKGVSVVSPAILRIPNTDIVNPPEASINMRILNLAGSPIGGKILDVTGGFINAESSTYAVKVEISGDTGHEGELSLEDAAVQLVRAEGSGFGDNFGSATASDGVSINESGQLALAKLADDFSYEETTEADFGTGTLSQVEAKSDGSLRLSPQISGYTADVTGSGTPISGGDNGSSTKDRAFDDDESTLWQASQTGSSIKDTAYIGYDFGSGVTKHIRRVRVKPGLYVASVMLQYSDNGTSWTDAQSLTFTSGSSWFSFDIGATGAHRFWRFLAKSGPAIQAWSIAEIEMMELLPDTYFTSGYRETIIDLSGKSALSGSKIEWDATTPANTAIQIQTALSTDGGSTYGSYQACTNGGAIPGISGANLANARLKIKENLSTSDTTTTPVLNSLSIELYAGYSASGSWEKAYDFTEVGTVDVIEGPVFWDDIPTGTTAVLKAAVSTDGGVTYGSYQQVFNDGKVIPGITLGMSSTGLWVKFRIELTTNDAGITPLVSMVGLGLYSANTKVYAINVSTLTGWDDIAIEWKSDRMSLIINGVEEAFIENPNRLATLGDYTYIGCDSSGNQIGTTIDELRIDNIYQSIDKVNAWCLINSPFYTSEEFKQWPGYIKVETDGLKVYDSESALRVLVGSWLKGALRKYGLKIIDGEIYSSLIRSGAEDADDYIQFNPPNSLEVYGTTVNGAGYKVMAITAPHSTTANYLGGIQWYSEYGSPRGSVYNEDNNVYIIATLGDVITNGLSVFGDITKTGSCSYAEPTDDYGTRLLYIVETPELLYYDRGVTNLINGEATIMLDPIFLQCIEPDTELAPWQIWVECYGENGVYVSEVGEDYFKVKERNSGTSANKVIWRLEATRKNYAGIRLMEVVK